ncbi:MAG: hypothetical protein GY853_14520 [PVC group bacterium]|nr:hypothetical protein [PVC group bacterium]
MTAKEKRLSELQTAQTGLLENIEIMDRKILADTKSRDRFADTLTSINAEIEYLEAGAIERMQKLADGIVSIETTTLQEFKIVYNDLKNINERLDSLEERIPTH